MFRAFYLPSKYGRSKVEKYYLVLSQKVHTPYTTHPPLHNCVARLGVTCMYVIRLRSALSVCDLSITDEGVHSFVYNRHVNF